MPGILREAFAARRKRGSRNSCRRHSKFRADGAVSNHTETRTTEVENARETRNLEALIDDILQEEGPMSLADLINLIAQPHSFDGFFQGALPTTDPRVRFN